MKIFRAALTAVLIYMVSISVAWAAKPTCILMKFTDDTRYDAVNSAETLSMNLLVELAKSGKVNLSASNLIDEDIEKLLYDEKAREYNILERAMRSNNFDELFEGAGFNENKAQSIATAQVGQYISPDITAAIGREHNAEYLIQGTIINLGVGNWWNNEYDEMSQAVNMASSFTSAVSASDFSGISGPLGFGGMDIKKSGIGVQCDVRIIKAETGEVIWCERVTETAIQKQYDVGPFSIGRGKLNSTLYAKAMDKAAKRIAEMLIAEVGGVL